MEHTALIEPPKPAETPAPAPPEANEEPDVQRRRFDALRSRITRRHKVLGGLGLAMTLAATSYLLIDNRKEDAEGARERTETTAIEALQDKEVTLVNSTVILHGGVHLRRTPDTVNNTLFGSKSNVMGEVDKGNVMVVPNPLLIENDLGEKWLGFSIGSLEPTGNKPDAIADQMVYVNAGSLETQSQNSSQPLIEYYHPGTNSWTTAMGETIDGTMDGSGTIHAMDPAVTLAVGTEIPDEDFNNLGQSMGQTWTTSRR